MTLNAATLRGRVTESSFTASVTGCVVQGFEAVRIGFPDLCMPCTIDTQSPTRVGAATLDEADTYARNA